MDTRFLEYILVLAETGNMTKAAKRLYISQPALSQFLAKQEAEFGHILLHRVNGKFCLTPAGELYADYARKILSMTDSLKQELQKITVAPHIILGTGTATANSILMQILPGFYKSYPETELTLTGGNWRSLSSAILAGDADLAFVAVPSLEPYKDHCIKLQEEEIVLAVPCNHPYCQRALSWNKHTLTYTEFKQNFNDMPIILQPSGSCIRYQVESFLGNDHAFTIACNTINAGDICNMVASNIGIGFIPSSYIPDSPKVVCYSLEPRLYRIHSILYRLDLELSAPFQLLIKLVRENMEQLNQNLLSFE